MKDELAVRDENDHLELCAKIFTGESIQRIKETMRRVLVPHPSHLPAPPAGSKEPTG